MSARRKVGFAAALLAAALVGTVASLVVAWAWTPTPETERPPASTVRSPPATRPSSAAQGDNRFVLSEAESQRLVTWARRFQACLARRGITVGDPVPHAKQIELRLGSAESPGELMPTTTACGDSLGEPPRRSSLQFRPGKLVLYLPKRCLLDPKVRSSAPDA
jgi:hypothetical protein